MLDHDACDKLAKWFEDRWNDRFCLDISKELVEIINTSWARPEPIPPYHIYVKMAYHLSQEARAGLTEFRIPSDFGNKLFEFQKAAVKIAAHHLNKRGGVRDRRRGGPGQDLMATALARIFEDDHGVETLIICPKNLVPMWEDYRQQYRLRAKVMSVSQRPARAARTCRAVSAGAHRRKPQPSQPRGQALPGHRRIHQLPTTAGSSCCPPRPTTRPISTFPTSCGCSSTKTRTSASGRRKFIRENWAKWSSSGATSVPSRSLAAFEKSEYADDWRDLMRLYLVRRTRSFIQENYAETRSRDAQSQVPGVRRRHAILLSRPRSQDGKVQDRRRRTQRPVCAALRRRRRAIRSTA